MLTSGIAAILWSCVTFLINCLCCSVQIHMLPTRTQDQAHHCPRAAWDIPLPPSSLHSTHTRPTATEPTPTLRPTERTYWDGRWVWPRDLKPRPLPVPAGRLSRNVTIETPPRPKTNITTHPITMTTENLHGRAWRRNAEDEYLSVPWVVCPNLCWDSSLWPFTKSLIYIKKKCGTESCA